MAAKARIDSHRLILTMKISVILCTYNRFQNLSKVLASVAVSTLPKSVDIVAEVVSGCRVEYALGGGPDLRCYRVNFDKINLLLLAFRPQWTARKGAQELYDAYRTVGLTAADIEQGRYVRINEIRRLQQAGRLEGALHWIGKNAKTTVGV